MTVTHKVGEHHLPLMEEGKGDTQRHVVDAQGNWVSLLCSVLNGVRQKKEQLSQVCMYIYVCVAKTSAQQNSSIYYQKPHLSTYMYLLSPLLLLQCRLVWGIFDSS